MFSCLHAYNIFISFNNKFYLILSFGIILTAYFLCKSFLSYARYTYPYAPLPSYWGVIIY